MSDEFKDLKHIYNVFYPRLGRYRLECKVRSDKKERRKVFELSQLNEAKRWVDLQLLRFGRSQEYNTFKKN